MGGVRSTPWEGSGVPMGGSGVPWEGSGVPHGSGQECAMIER